MEDKKVKTPKLSDAFNFSGVQGDSNQSVIDNSQDFIDNYKNIDENIKLDITKLKQGDNIILQSQKSPFEKYQVEDNIEEHNPESFDLSEQQQNQEQIQLQPQYQSKDQLNSTEYLQYQGIQTEEQLLVTNVTPLKMNNSNQQLQEEEEEEEQEVVQVFNQQRFQQKKFASKTPQQEQDQQIQEQQQSIQLQEAQNQLQGALSHEDIQIQEQQQHEDELEISDHEHQEDAPLTLDRDLGIENQDTEKLKVKKQQDNEVEIVKEQDVDSLLELDQQNQNMDIDDIIMIDGDEQQEQIYSQEEEFPFFSTQWKKTYLKGQELQQNQDEYEKKYNLILIEEALVGINRVPRQEKKEIIARVEVNTQLETITLFPVLKGFESTYEKQYSYSKFFEYEVKVNKPTVIKNQKIFQDLSQYMMNFQNVQYQTIDNSTYPQDPEISIIEENNNNDEHDLNDEINEQIKNQENKDKQKKQHEENEHKIFENFINHILEENKIELPTLPQIQQQLQPLTQLQQQQQQINSEENPLEATNKKAKEEALRKASIMKSLEFERQQEPQNQKKSTSFFCCKKKQKDIPPPHMNNQNETLKQQQEKKQKALTLKEAGNKFDQLCKLRGYFRLCCHFIISTMMVCIFVGFYYGMYRSDTHTVIASPNMSVNIHLSNCLLNIYDTDSNKVEIDYVMHKSVWPWPSDGELKRDASDFILSEISSNRIEFRAYSDFKDLKYCFVKLYLPKIQYSNLNVQCSDVSTCVIVSNHQDLRVQSSEFKSLHSGSEMKANIRSLNFQEKFEFIANNEGALYLQNFQGLQSQDPNHMNRIHIRQGEIVLQSIENYYIDFFSPIESICYNAPNIVNGIQEFNCKQSTQSTFYTPPTPQQQQQQQDNNEHSDQEADPSHFECSGDKYLCKEKDIDCSTQQNIPKFQISIAFHGNIYANIIPELGQAPTKDNEQLMGRIYDDGIAFNEELQQKIEDIVNSNEAQAEPIFIIDLGDKLTQQERNQLWVKSFNPSYAQFRPWWLASLSFNLLVTSTFNVKGYLSPGFCPYTTSLDINEYFQTQLLIKNTIKYANVTDRSSINFVQSDTHLLPSKRFQKSSGINLYKDQRANKEEQWYEIVENNKQLIIKSYDLKDNVQIIGTLVTSIFVSLFITFYFLYVIYLFLPYFKERLSNTSGQFTKYTTTESTDAVLKQKKQNQIEQDEENQDNDDHAFDIEVKTKKEDFEPSIISTLDFQNFLYTRKNMNSAQIFFSTLFCRADEEMEQMLLDDEIVTDDLLEIQERKLKQMYEKFCFLNHLTEKNLSSKPVQQILDFYGYNFMPDKSSSLKFLKIREKSKPEKFFPDPQILKNNKPITLFIQTYYEITGRDNDDVWVDDMRDLYHNFCNEYRIKVQDFVVQDISKQYGISLVEKQQMKLCMKREVHKQQNEEKSWKDKLFAKLHLKRDKYGKYLIQTEQLELHVSLMSDQATYTAQHLRNLNFSRVFWNEVWDMLQIVFRARYDILFNPEETAFMSTIYGSNWQLVDISILIQHLVVNVAIITPLVLFTIINQISYAPYSLNHPVNLFSDSDMKFSTVYFPWYLDHCNTTMLVALIVIFTYLVIQIVEEAVILYKTKFPIDRAFEDQKRNKSKLINRMQMFLMVLFLFFDIFYICMNLLWLVLGAIINPNYFLIYATSVATLITFVTSKKKEFDDIHEGGLEKIKEILMKEYGKKIQNIMSTIEAEKSSFLMQVNSMKEEAENKFIQMSSVIGLGDQAKNMVNKIEDQLPDLEKLTLEDMDPTKIEEKSKQLEENLKKEAQNTIIEELEKVGITKEFAHGMYKLIIEQDKHGAKQIIADEVSKGTDDKLPTRLISFILNQVLNEKKFDPRDMSVEMQDTIIDIILELVMGKDSKELNLDIRKLLNMILVLIEALQSQDLSKIMSVFKEIMYLIPLQEGEDWRYSPTPTFILKFIDILSKVFSGHTNSHELSNIVKESLQMAQIPNEIGLFLTVMLPSNKNSSTWEYGDIKIESIEQLRQFVEVNIIQKIVGKNLVHPKQIRTLGYVFSTIFKLIRGDLDFNAEIQYFKFLIQELNHIPEFILEFIEIGAKMAPLMVLKEENYPKKIQHLSSETNIPRSHIRGLFLSGTEQIYKKFAPQGRIPALLDDKIASRFLRDITETMGLQDKPQLYLGLLNIFHGKEQHSEQSQEIINHSEEEFLEFLYETIQLKSQYQQQLFQAAYNIMFSKSFWDLEKILIKFMKNPEVSSHIQKQLANDKDTTILDLFNIWFKFSCDGDWDQLQKFMTKSYQQIAGKNLIQFWQNLFQPFNKDQNSIQSKLIKQLKKQLQSQGHLIKTKSQSSKIKKIYNKVNPNHNLSETEIKQNKQITELYRQYQQIQNEYNCISLPHKPDSLSFFQKNYTCYTHLIEILQGIDEKLLKKDSHSTGKQHLFKLKRSEDHSLYSLIDFIIDQFKVLGMNNQAQNLLRNLFKFGYLQVEEQGHDGNDRLTIIQDCAKNLKISKVVLTQIISIFQISAPQSKNNIQELYARNPKMAPKCFNEQFVKDSINQVLNFIVQANKCNFSSLDFLYKEQSKHKLPTSKIMQFIDRHDLFTLILNSPQNLSNIGKETISELIHKVVQIFTKEIKILTEDEGNHISKIIYSLLYTVEDLNLEKLLKYSYPQQEYLQQYQNIQSNLLLKQDIQNMISLYKFSLDKNFLGSLNLQKNIMKQQLIINKAKPHDIEIQQFIFDLVAGVNYKKYSINMHHQDYKPTDQYKKIYDYIPLIKYRFVKDTQQFCKFAHQISKSLFKFDAITQKQLQILFSLFSESPQRDEASSLLNIDSYVIEMAVGMSQLIIGQNQKEYLQNIVKYQGFSKLCKKGQLNKQETVLLLSLTLKVLDLDDLHEFFKVFGIDQDVDIMVLKGFFAFMMPPIIKNKITATEQRNEYLRNYSSRKYLFNKIQAEAKEELKISKIKENYEVYELYYNIKHGRFVDILTQTQEHEAITNSNIFGRQKYLKQTLCGLIGYLNSKKCQLPNQQDDLNDTFSKFRKELQGIQNNTLGAYYLLSQNLDQSLFQNITVLQCLNEEPFQEIFLQRHDQLSHKKLHMKNQSIKLEFGSFYDTAYDAKPENNVVCSFCTKETLALSQSAVKEFTCNFCNRNMQNQAYYNCLCKATEENLQQNQSQLRSPQKSKIQDPCFKVCRSCYFIQPYTLVLQPKSLKDGLRQLYTFKIEKKIKTPHNHISLGICDSSTLNKEQTKKYKTEKNSYLWYSNGHITQNGKPYLKNKKMQYGKSLNHHDILSLELNSKKTQITFEKGMQKIVVPFSSQKIDPENLAICITLPHPEDQLTLISSIQYHSNETLDPQKFNLKKYLYFQQKFLTHSQRLRILESHFLTQFFLNNQSSIMRKKDQLKMANLMKYPDLLFQKIGSKYEKILCHLFYFYKNNSPQLQLVHQYQKSLKIGILQQDLLFISTLQACRYPQQSHTNRGIENHYLSYVMQLEFIMTYISRAQFLKIEIDQNTDFSKNYFIRLLATVKFHPYVQKCYINHKSEFFNQAFSKIFPEEPRYYSQYSNLECSTFDRFFYPQQTNNNKQRKIEDILHWPISLSTTRYKSPLISLQESVSQKQKDNKKVALIAQGRENTFKIKNPIQIVLEDSGFQKLDRETLEFSFEITSIDNKIYFGLCSSPSFSSSFKNNSRIEKLLKKKDNLKKQQSDLNQQEQNELQDLIQQTGTNEQELQEANNSYLIDMNGIFYANQQVQTYSQTEFKFDCNDKIRCEIFKKGQNSFDRNMKGESISITGDSIKSISPNSYQQTQSFCLLDQQLQDQKVYELQFQFSHELNQQYQKQNFSFGITKQKNVKDVQFVTSLEYLLKNNLPNTYMLTSSKQLISPYPLDNSYTQIFKNLDLNDVITIRVDLKSNLISFRNPDTPYSELQKKKNNILEIPIEQYLGLDDDDDFVNEPFYFVATVSQGKGSIDILNTELYQLQCLNENTQQQFAFDFKFPYSDQDDSKMHICFGLGEGDGIQLQEENNRSIIQYYEEFLQQYAQLYLNPSRFYLMDNLELQLNSPYSKQKRSSIQKILYGIQRSQFLDPQTLKNQDLKYELTKPLLQEFLNENDNIHTNIQNYSQAPSVEIQKYMIKILIQNLNQYNNPILSLTDSIEKIINSMSVKFPGVLGSENIKNLILSMLRVMTEKQSYTLVQQIIKQLANIRSNTKNMEVFLKLLCNYEDNGQVLNNFLNVFISPKFFKQFQGIFYIQLLRLGKLNIMKLATKMVISDLEQQPDLNLTKDKKHDIQTKTRTKTNQILSESLSALLQNLQFSENQLRILVLLVKCLAGSNDSWLYLFVEKLSIFSDIQNEAVRNIGEDFLIFLFQHSEQILDKYVQQGYSLKQIKELEKANLKQVFNYYNTSSSSSTLRKKINIFKEFFQVSKLETNLSQNKIELNDADVSSDEEFADDLMNKDLNRLQTKGNKQSLRFNPNSQANLQQQTFRQKFFSSNYIQNSKPIVKCINFCKKIIQANIKSTVNLHDIIFDLYLSKERLVDTVPDPIINTVKSLNTTFFKDIVQNPSKSMINDRKIAELKQIMRHLLDSVSENQKQLFDIIFDFIQAVMNEQSLSSILFKLLQLYVPNCNYYFNPSKHSQSLQPWSISSKDDQENQDIYKISYAQHKDKQLLTKSATNRIFSFQIKTMGQKPIFLGICEYKYVSRTQSDQFDPQTQKGYHGLLVLNSQGTTYSENEQENNLQNPNASFKQGDIITVIIPPNFEEIYFYKNLDNLQKYSNQTNLSASNFLGQQPVAVLKQKILEKQYSICVGLTNQSMVHIAEGFGPQVFLKSSGYHHSQLKVLGISGMISLNAMLHSSQIDISEQINGLDIIPFFMSNIVKHFYQIMGLETKHMDFMSQLSRNFILDFSNQKKGKNIIKAYQQIIKEKNHSQSQKLSNISANITHMSEVLSKFATQVKEQNNLEQNDIIQLIEPIYKPIMKLFHFKDEKLTNFSNFIKILYSYFSNHVDISENSEAWRLVVHEQSHQKCISDIMFMITGEEKKADIPSFIRGGLSLVGDCLLIGFDVLQNKNNISIREYLQKYQSVIRYRIFNTIKIVFAEILQDEQFEDIINDIMNLLLLIFYDSERILSQISHRQSSLLKNIKPLFVQILKTGFQIAQGGKPKNLTPEKQQLQIKHTDDIDLTKSSIKLLQHKLTTIKKKMGDQKQIISQKQLKNMKTKQKLLEDKHRVKSMLGNTQNSLSFGQYHPDFKSKINNCSLNIETDTEYLKFNFSHKPIKMSGQSKKHFAFKMKKGKFLYAAIGIGLPDLIKEKTSLYNQLDQNLKTKEQREFILKESDSDNFLEMQKEFSNSIYHQLYMINNTGWTINGSYNTQKQQGLKFQEDDIIYCTFDPIYGYILFEKENEDLSVKIPLAQKDKQVPRDTRNFHICVILQNSGDEIQIIEDIEMVRSNKLEYIRNIAVDFDKNEGDKHKFSNLVAINTLQLNKNTKIKQDNPYAVLSTSRSGFPRDYNFKYHWYYRIDNIEKKEHQNIAVGVQVREQNSQINIAQENTNQIIFNDPHRPPNQNIYMLSGQGYLYQNSNVVLQKQIEFSPIYSHDACKVVDDHVFLDIPQDLEIPVISSSSTKLEENFDYSLNFSVNSHSEESNIGIGVVDDSFGPTHKFDLMTGNKIWCRQYTVLNQDGSVYSKRKVEAPKDFTFDHKDQMKMDICYESNLSITAQKPKFISKNPLISIEKGQKYLQPFRLGRYNKFADLQALQQQSDINFEQYSALLLLDKPLKKYRSYQIKFHIQKLAQFTTFHLGLCKRSLVEKRHYIFDQQQENEEQSCFLVDHLGNPVPQSKLIEKEDEFKLKEGDEILMKIDDEHSKLEIKNLSSKFSVIIQLDPLDYDKFYWPCFALKGQGTHIEFISMDENCRNQLIFTNLTKKKICRLSTSFSFLGNRNLPINIVAVMQKKYDMVTLQGLQQIQKPNFVKQNNIVLDNQEKVKCELEYLTQNLCKLKYDYLGTSCEQYIPIKDTELVYPCIGVSCLQDKITMEEVEKHNTELVNLQQDAKDLRMAEYILSDNISKYKQNIIELDNKIFLLDDRMASLVGNVSMVIEKVDELQKVYKEQLKPLIDYFQINSFDFQIFATQFIPIMVQLVNSNFDERTQSLISKISQSLIALINQQFDKIDDEFFLLLQVNPKDINLCRTAIANFTQLLVDPLNYLNQKKSQTMNFVNVKLKDSQFSDINRIKEKLDDQGIAPKDMFKLADISGDAFLDMREFRLYFKKIGIELSEHRVKEVFSYAKQQSSAQSSDSQLLDQDEFIKAYDYIQEQSIFLTLESMGISKHVLMYLLIGLIIILLLIFVFIFIGVKAFAIPGVFGSMVNSCFPVLGGGGLAQGNKKDPEKTLQIDRIKSIVQESIQTIQSSV